VLLINWHICATYSLVNHIMSRLPVFWAVTLCSPVGRHQCFQDTCLPAASIFRVQVCRVKNWFSYICRMHGRWWLRLQVWRWRRHVLLKCRYPPMRLHGDNPRDHNLKNHHHENLEVITLWQFQKIYSAECEVIGWLEMASLKDVDMADFEIPS
jgi:hypothetical protein